MTNTTGLPSAGRQNTYSIPAFRQEVSDPIKAARVICILAMIYVHVNPGVAELDPETYGIQIFDIVRTFVTSTLGRASSVLLCVVSGYLAVFSLARSSFGAFLMKRVQSLVIPTALWSAFMLALFYLGSYVEPGYLERSLGAPFSVWSLPNYLVGLTTQPANLPLAFLRDLFVCASFTAILMTAWSRGWKVYALVTTAIVCVGAVTPLLITPTLFLYYAIGVAIGVSGKVLFFGARTALISAVLVAIIGVNTTWVLLNDAGEVRPLTSAMLEFWLTAVRFPAAIVFWWASVEIARRSWGRHLIAFEPSIFNAFCSHMVVLTAMWVIWKSLFGGYYGNLYPVFFALSPVAVVLISRVTVPVLAYFSPSFFTVLNGGRAYEQPKPSKSPGAAAPSVNAAIAVSAPELGTLKPPPQT